MNAPTTPNIPPNPDAGSGLVALPTSSHGFGYSAPYREQTRYQRMFAHLPPMPAPGAGVLETLAAQMVDQDTAAIANGGWPPPPAGNPGDNAAIDAGWTYFGQFIDHDLTFDPISTLTSAQTPDANLLDLRTARFDLDSLYGHGADDQPYLYDINDRAKLLIDNFQGSPVEFDLPRNTQERALIGDPRNDIHIIISQLHLAFARMHNAIVATTRAQHPEWSTEDVFKTAQRDVVWHYQWLVTHQYLELHVGSALRQQTLSDAVVAAPGQQGTPARANLTYFHPAPGAAYIPFEFSTAAFRFGHSQVRPTYHLNNAVGPVPIFDGTQNAGAGDLRGFRVRPSGWTVDWSLFFTGAPGQGPVQKSRSIDTLLAPALAVLPTTVVTDGGPNSLAVRNLRRGVTLGLPSGQDVARELGVTPLDSLAGQPLPDPAPLWFYVLAEAQAGGGTQLGPVGGRIVAETLIGLLAADESSWLNQNPLWTPTRGQVPGTFTINDLFILAA